MDLRHDLRLPVQCPIQYSGKQIAGEGTLVNLSTGGYGITSEHPLPQGTSLSLRIYLPDGGTPIEVEVATVRWSRSGRLGLKNMIIRQEEIKRLRHFVASHSKPADFSFFTKG